MSADIDRENQLIVEHLRHALPGLVAVYRFGSTVRGGASAASDIDVAFLGAEPVSPTRRFDVQEDVAVALGRDVDLVDLSTATPVMAMQVITSGQVLWEDDAAARGRFEDRTFGAYARLNEERRGILDRVAAEGTVYGR